jgi:hypothetical protein
LADPQSRICGAKQHAVGQAGTGHHALTAFLGSRASLDQASGATHSASGSGVNVHAVAKVQADRLQDRKGGGAREYIHGSQQVGVLLDDGRSGSIRRRIQVAPDRSPEVLPYFWKYGVGPTAASAVLAPASMSALYCWCTGR